MKRDPSVPRPAAPEPAGAAEEAPAGGLESLDRSRLIGSEILQHPPRDRGKQAEQGDDDRLHDAHHDDVSGELAEIDGALVAGREQQVRRLLERMAPVRPRANEDLLAPYLEALNEIRTALRSPAQIAVERDDVPGLEELFDSFREAMRSQDAMDHDEQIYGAVEVLLSDPGVRAWAQGRCRHLLVDEFQDLTPAHLLMIRLLAALSAGRASRQGRALLSVAGIALGVVHSDQVQFSGVAPMVIHLADRDETVTIAGLGGWPRAARLETFVEAHGGAIPAGLLRHRRRSLAGGHYQPRRDGTGGIISSPLLPTLHVRRS